MIITLLQLITQEALHMYALLVHPIRHVDVRTEAHAQMHIHTQTHNHS